MSRLYTGYIDEDQCMGDTLGPKLGGVAGTINQNFYNLDVRVQSLTGASNTQDVRITSLNTRVNSLSSQLLPTVLFVPANYGTQSNSHPFLINWSATGTTSLDPWWSGRQTVTVPNVPANTVGILVEAVANVNARANNSQRVYFYKDSEEVISTPTSGKVVLPSNSNTASNITQTQYNNITTNSETYRRIVIDPVHGETIDEGESSVTFPIYINSTTRQFRWFWTDGKADATAPTSNPEYSLNATLIGYYVRVT